MAQSKLWRSSSRFLFTKLKAISRVLLATCRTHFKLCPYPPLSPTTSTVHDRVPAASHTVRPFIHHASLNRSHHRLSNPRLLRSRKPHPRVSLKKLSPSTLLKSAPDTPPAQRAAPSTSHPASAPEYIPLLHHDAGPTGRCARRDRGSS